MEMFAVHTLKADIILNFAAAFIIPAMLATLLGLTIMPPKSLAELLARSFSSVIAAFAFGPLLAAEFVAWQPGVLEAASGLAQWSNSDGNPHDNHLLALFYVLGPAMMLSGLPAWWVLGAYMRWMTDIKAVGFRNWLIQVIENFLKR